MTYREIRFLESRINTYRRRDEELQEIVADPESAVGILVRDDLVGVRAVIAELERLKEDLIVMRCK